MSRYLLMIDKTKVRFLNQIDDPTKFQHIANVLDAVVDSDPEPEPPDELIQAIKSRECILFVGAAMSARANFPTWKPFIEGLLKRSNNE